MMGRYGIKNLFIDDSDGWFCMNRSATDEAWLGFFFFFFLILPVGELLFFSFLRVLIDVRSDLETKNKKHRDKLKGSQIDTKQSSHQRDKQESHTPNVFSTKKYRPLLRPRRQCHRQRRQCSETQSSSRHSSCVGGKARGPTTAATTTTRYAAIAY